MNNFRFTHCKRLESLLTLAYRLFLLCVAALLFSNGLKGAIPIGSSIDGIEAGSKSGSAVSMSADGTILAIGAPLATNSDGAATAGQVRIFERNVDTGEWDTLIGTLEGQSEDEDFGQSVSLSADASRIAVGVPRYDTVGGGAQTGAVRVYEYDSMSDTWVQLGGDIVGDETAAQFGYSTALSRDGTTVVAGARFHDGSVPSAPENAIGQAKVFTYNSATLTWDQKGESINGYAADEQSSSAVAISGNGNTVALGDPRTNASDPAVVEAGRVRVYNYESTDTWTLSGEFFGTVADGELGRSVSINDDGTVVAAGAMAEDDNLVAGRVVVWEFDTSWNQLGPAIETTETDDRFGSAVALNSEGYIVATGASRNSVEGNNRGLVQAFSYDAGADAWVQIGGDLYGESNNDKLGTSVALSSSGYILAAGAVDNDNGGSNAGQVGVYYMLSDFSSVRGLVDYTEDSVASNPSDYGLYTQSEYLESRVAGQEDVTTNPYDYGLYVETDISDARVAGQEDVTADPHAYGLYTEEDLGGDTGAAREAGQQDVIADPHAYGLFEENDLEDAADTARTLVNVSTLSGIDGDQPTTLGFVVTGESKQVLVRAVGPKLTDLGIESPLPDPALSVYHISIDDLSAELIATIDNWTSGLTEAEVAALKDTMDSVGAFPLDPTDDFQGLSLPTDDATSAAVVLTLEEGVYTCVATSADGGEGRALIEVYQVMTD